VLSEGRAWLGIGAGSSEQEARGLGLPFPPAGQRFERLEEALQICLQMWSADDGHTSASTVRWRAEAAAYGLGYQASGHVFTSRRAVGGLGAAVRRPGRYL